MSYEIGRDLERIRHELDEACRRLDAHTADGHSSEVGAHEHELTPAEVQDVVEAAAEALAAVAEEAPEEVQAEVTEAAVEAAEAAVAVAEAVESTDAGEEPPDRTHPLYARV